MKINNNVIITAFLLLAISLYSAPVFAADLESVIWVGTGTEIIKLDSDGNKLVTISDQGRQFSIDPIDGGIWTVDGSDQKVTYYDFNGKEILAWNENDKGRDAFRVLDIHVDYDGYLWAGTKMERGETTMTYHSLPSINSSYVLFKIAPNGSKISEREIKRKPNKIVSDKETNSILIINETSLLKLSNNSIDTLKKFPYEPLLAQMVVSKRGGHVFVGKFVDGNIYDIDITNKTVIELKGLESPTNYPFRRTQTFSTTIGGILVGRYNYNTLAMIDANKKIRYMKNEVFKNIKVVYVDEDDYIWIGDSDNTLYKISNDGQVLKYVNIPNDIELIQSVKVVENENLVKQRHPVKVEYKNKIIIPNYTKVYIKTYEFTPSIVNIQEGGTVEWVQINNVNRTIVINGNWSSPILTKGSSFNYTFNKAGVYEYYSPPQKHVGGKIVVEPRNKQNNNQGIKPEDKTSETPSKSPETHSTETKENVNEQKSESRNIFDVIFNLIKQIFTKGQEG